MTTRYRTGVAALALLGIVLGGCDQPTGPAPLLEQLPRPLTASEARVIEASNDFAFDLFHDVYRTEEGANVIVSPLSVSMALGMAMNGAGSETWAEMRHALRFGDLDQKQINDSYRGLIDLLAKLDPATGMQIANSVWYRNDFPFEKRFFDVVSDRFDAEVAGLDFDDLASKNTVNEWVRRQTDGKIAEILERIDPEDVMYLINAIAFHGDWRTRFDPASTQEQPFWRADGSSVQVPMMSQTGTYRYASTPHYQAVELPFGNGAFVMTLVIPHEASGLTALLGAIGATGWRNLTEALVERQVSLAIPRFQLEYEKKLNDTLKALGMELAFIGGAADFTGMSKEEGRRLFLSEVLHKTFIEVDEEGTQAAAVTKVEVGITSAPPTITADRPFFFAIRERFSGTLLFVGAIGDPTSE